MNNTTLKVSDRLTEKQILFFSAEAPKPEIFEKLIATLNLPNADAALQAILHREQWGSTEVASGLLLPHARLPGLKHIAAAIGVCPKRIFVLFVGPTEDMKVNLEFLASVSTLFQAQGLLTSLMELKTPQAVLDKIHDAETLS